MTIEHDEAWLLANTATSYSKQAATTYYEHMTRWRNIDEQPVDGMRIELVGETGYGSIEFPEEATNPLLELCVMHDAVAWRYAPLGDVPNFITEIK